MSETVLSISACWMQFLMDPDSEPPGRIRIGFLSGREPFRVIGDFYIGEVQNIPEGVEMGLQALAAMNITLADNFTLVYPQYDTENEMALNAIAGYVLDEAEQHGWEFDREIPPVQW